MTVLVVHFLDDEMTFRGVGRIWCFVERRKVLGLLIIDVSIALWFVF